MVPDSADVVVIGGGPAGLAGALFFARRGARVVVLEPEGAPPEGDADDDVRNWSRRAVPQARHSHQFLGLAAKVLTDEAPDVISALRDRGVAEMPASFQGRGAIPGASRLLSRRLVFEGVLRRVVLAERRVVMLAEPMRELLAKRGRSPVVCGAVSQSGHEVLAPLVVDASGRRSQVTEWVAPLGVAELPTDIQPIGLQYYTRFYRLRDNVQYPTIESAIAARFPYATVLAFPSDNRTFSLTIACFVDDPCRRALAEPAVFERICAHVAVTAPWIESGEPISPVHAMARIENRWRRLVDDHGDPLIDGLVLVGDSSMHTNPTFGRGVSLAFAQAQHVADIASTSDGNGITGPIEQWTRAQHGDWYAIQERYDRMMVDRFRATVHGEPYRPEGDTTSRTIVAMAAAAPTDDVAAEAMSNFYHLLRRPSEIFADAKLQEHLDAFVATHGLRPPEPDGPTRQQFEELVAAS